ncbi:hypothetical protein [Sphingomonas sp. Leaf343]|uniref:hypothetical protein n=1 Tax=Sphingomonas sp. Leaf343 TaxID=1736345 RepID=UPI0012E1087B|nr:hypothetical protein [Sphingomonas sp. Leaf343]
MTWLGLNGIEVRVAGIDARKVNASCRRDAPSPPGMPAPTVRHRQVRPVAARLTLGKRLICQPVDRSYRRMSPAERCRMVDRCRTR